MAADGRVEAGQPIRQAFSARAWNRAQDAADIVLGTRGGYQGLAAPAGPLPYTWVLGRNNSGDDVARWSGLAISGLEVEPDDAAGESQFGSLPIVSCAAMATSTTAWCVAVEPIVDGAIGRVAVAGVVQAKVTISSSDDQFLAAGDDELVTGSSGEASILWKESGTGADKWALIRFGAGGGGSEFLFGITRSVWNKDNQEDVELFDPNNSNNVYSPPRYQRASNPFVTIGSQQVVVLAKVNNVWLPIVAECTI